MVRHLAGEPLVVVGLIDAGSLLDVLHLAVIPRDELLYDATTILLWRGPDVAACVRQRSYGYPANAVFESWRAKLIGTRKGECGATFSRSCEMMQTI